MPAWLAAAQASILRYLDDHRPLSIGLFLALFLGLEWLKHDMAPMRALAAEKRQERIARRYR